MGSIWKPTVQSEPYRGNIQSHRDFWTPAQTPDLYHYGRKGMKWYQHIFGNINLKAMGTGVGNLLDEEKIKEIARKLGIPLNQINQKMGLIREYFMKERQQQIGSSNPPAYEKTQRDAREIKKIAESIRRDVSTRNWERASQDIALEKRRLGQLDEYNHRFEPPEVKAAKEEARRKQIEAEEQAEVDSRRESVRYNQRKQQEYEARQEERARAAEELKRKRMKEGLESMREEDRAKAVRREMQKEQEQKAKEQRRQEFIEEQMEEQRRAEEEAYKQYKKRMTPTSGGGHKF